MIIFIIGDLNIEYVMLNIKQMVFNVQIFSSVIRKPTSPAGVANEAEEVCDGIISTTKNIP